MKIVNKYKMIISLSILAASIFFLVFHLMQRDKTRQLTRPSSAAALEDVNSLTADEESTDFCEIPTIFKFGPAALESFAQLEIEEETSILLPKIAWCDESAEGPAINIETFEDRFYIETPASTEGEMKTLQKDPQSETNKRNLHPDLFYLFWATPSKNKIEY